MTIDRSDVARKSSLYVNRVLEKHKESVALPRKASVSSNAKLIGSLICEGEGVKKKLNIPRLEIPTRSLDIASDFKPVAASERLNDRSSIAALLIKAQSPKVAIGSKVLTDIISGTSIKRPGGRLPF